MFSRRKHHTSAPMASTHTHHRGSRGGIFNRRPQRAPLQRRKPSFRDKVSGALSKLKGSLTGRPGTKATGTRRMPGTDGRGSHRRGRRFF